MAHATLVNVDIETAPKLALFISNAIGGEQGQSYLEDCQALITNAKTSDLLMKFLDKSEVILNSENEKDAESCFQAIVSILYTLEDEASIQSVIDETITRVCLSESEKCTLRLRTLVSFFNLLISVPAKLSVLKALFNYAIKTNQTPLVAHFSDSVSRWIDSWNLTVSEQRDLLWILSQVQPASQNGHAASPTLKFLIKYLNTFDGQEYSAEATRTATSAVVSAIRSPLASFDDRSALYKTISTHNVNSAELNKLITLLGIICNDDIASFETFQLSNGDLLAAYTISPDAVTHTLRLLKLCNITARVSQSKSATDTQTRPGEVSYGVIATGLGVDIDDVEMWVVDAISNGLMTATIDQLRRVVVVSRCVQATFEMDQWVDLSRRLGAWKSGLGHLLEAVEEHNRV